MTRISAVWLFWGPMLPWDFSVAGFWEGNHLEARCAVVPGKRSGEGSLQSVYPCGVCTCVCSARSNPEKPQPWGMDETPLDFFRELGAPSWPLSSQVHGPFTPWPDFLVPWL